MRSQPGNGPSRGLLILCYGEIFKLYCLLFKCLHLIILLSHSPECEQLLGPTRRAVLPGHQPRQLHGEYSTVQYSTVQYSTVQFSTVQYRSTPGTPRGPSRSRGCPGSSSPPPPRSLSLQSPWPPAHSEQRNNDNLDK